MAVKRYNGTSWDTVAGVGAPGANGTNGTNGLDSSPFVGGKNAVLNSAFNVWQRGTSFTNVANVYGPDRWLMYRSNANTTVSRQLTNDTTNLPNIQYAARMQRTASSTSLDTFYLLNMFETVNSIPFAGKTVTFSFYARAGANYSATSNVLNAILRTGTGTDQSWISGYTGDASPITGSATLTTTWQRFTYTGTIATTATELTLGFTYTPIGTAGAADFFEVTGVQLEVGSVATPYAPYSPTYQGELAACQRYYVRWTGSASYPRFASKGVSVSSTNVYFYVDHPVEMRVAPTAIEFSTLAAFNFTPNVYALSALILDNRNTKISALYGTTSGMTSNQFMVLVGNDTSNGYLGLSSEL
jgi:hypothetical protein